MTVYRRLSVLTLCAASVMLGCGGDDPKGGAGPAGSGSRATVKADADLAHLMPADAIGVLYVPSLAALDAKVKALLASIDPESAKDGQVSDLLRQMLGPAGDQLDTAGPVAVALSAGEGEGARPMPTMIVPVRDVAATKKAFGEPPPGQPGQPGRPGPPAPVVRGRFVAMSMGPGIVPGGVASPLLNGMPAGDVVVRLDLARSASMLREGIASLNSKPRKPVSPPDGSEPPEWTPARDPMAGLGKMMDGVVAFLEKSERLDLVFRLDKTTVHLDVAYTAKDAGTIGGLVDPAVDLAALAACLPRDYPIAVLMAVRLDEMNKWSSSMMEASMATMPEEARTSARAMMGRLNEVYALLDGGAAMAMEFGTAGMEGVLVMSAKDPKAFVAKWEEVLKSGEYSSAAGRMGAKAEEMPVTTVAGVEVRTLKMTLDVDKFLESSARPAQGPRAAAAAESIFKSMYGPDGMMMRTAVIGNRILCVMGGDDAEVERAIMAAKSPTPKSAPALSSALANVGGKPAFVARVELRETITGVASIVGEVMKSSGAPGMRDVPSVPPGAPVPLILFGTADGRVFRGGLSVDVGAVAELLKPMFKRPAPLREPVDDIRPPMDR